MISDETFRGESSRPVNAYNQNSLYQQLYMFTDDEQDQKIEQENFSINQFEIKSSGARRVVP